MRKDIKKHVKEDCPNREHECELCGLKDRYYEMKWSHHQTCPKKNISCPNKCGITMERQRCKEHVATECELTTIPCKYKKLGCGVTLKRADMAAHEEDDKLHFHMAIDTTSRLRNELGLALRRITTLEATTSSLKNELDTAIHYALATAKDLENFKKFFTNSEHAQNIKLIGYQEMKQNNTIFQSQPFYTSRAGYKMFISVYPNGDEGGNNHLSIYISSSRGRYDEKLTWPFAGDINITLLNQLEDKKYFSRLLPVKAERNFLVGNGLGYSTFIPHSELGYDQENSTQYLKDDTLYFRVL